MRFPRYRVEIVLDGVTCDYLEIMYYTGESEECD